MITTSQAKEYLEAQGVELPDVVLNLMIEQANSINDCLEANYPTYTATLIQLYLIELLGLVHTNKRISSQSAPNGASQSFNYVDFNARIAATRTSLISLDKHHCASEFIPPDPEQNAYAGLWIGKAGRK